ncbi:hypothetical protein GALMADRAFT_65656 [Galerina marginata CBS 339.88]|uniref:Acid proteinase n=1 Tax=Galerina marginata (strain CBS 339.88) TaxID=685588 RepID=A0A067TCJ9_GALM3|nr:hypothetical protein GALMADRAFT_65656 [Galerina marginata CBS 339.88]
MVFAFALLSNLLFAAAAFASPSNRLADRVARRAARQSLPNNRIGSGVEAFTNTSHVEFSSNWAGAVWDSEPAGTFKSVTGTFTVPTPKGSSGAASAWVGIDGDTCGSAILQTGIDFTISNGKVSFDAWYEWFPDFAHDFTGISISAGNQIKLTVTASTTKSGTAVIQNLSTGQTVTKSLTSTSALCEQNAEWIVEDFESGGSLVPFANFGTVTFTNAVATTFSGSTLTPSGSTIIDIKQGSTVLTSVTTGSSTVTISHT